MSADFDFARGDEVLRHHQRELDEDGLTRVIAWVVIVLSGTGIAAIASALVCLVR